MGDLLFPAPEFLFLYSTKQLCMSLNLCEISSVRLAFTGCLGWNRTQGSDASALGSQALLGHRLTSLFETLSMFNMKVLPWNRTCVTGNKELTEVTDFWITGLVFSTRGVAPCWPFLRMHTF